jgi:NAD(P)H-flavin reductase
MLKKYATKDSFSGFLHANVNNKDQLYSVQGPLGLGLKIKNDYSGHLVLFAGGTGIFPFLDLLDFIFKKTVYTVVRNCYGDAFA